MEKKSNTQLIKEREITAIRRELRSCVSLKKARVLRSFFKTGPGDYGEGDRFLGVTVPDIRHLVKKYQDVAWDDILDLLRSEFHEERLLALLIWVKQFEKGKEKNRQKIYKAYLKNMRQINNWDLVDLTADKIVGAYLENKSKSILFELAESKNLWERRIAILATFHFIKKGQSAWTLKLVEKLLTDKHDLIHKAAGWMLREVGKRCEEKTVCDFLDKYAAQMPRTMLRYAIERFSPEERKHYLARKQ